jgi:hypothetical protein
MTEHRVGARLARPRRQRQGKFNSTLHVCCSGSSACFRKSGFMVHKQASVARNAVPHVMYENDECMGNFFLKSPFLSSHCGAIFFCPFASKVTWANQCEQIYPVQDVQVLLNGRGTKPGSSKILLLKTRLIDLRWAAEGHSTSRSIAGFPHSLSQLAYRQTPC